MTENGNTADQHCSRLAHLDRLESESIHVIRETASQFRSPVILYSIGKDSSVLLNLAMKAFAPGKLPFPVLHIDTGWKFHEMISFRDETAKANDLDLIVHTNPDGLAQGIGPISHGSAVHTEVMKTEALKQALNDGRFDAALGGARRDEEASRSKERIFSVRGAAHHWNAKSQRPELWSLYNSSLGPGETMRVFPLSNWTESDVWHYIHRENIPVVPLYFAAERPVIHRDGQLIVRDDERLPLLPREEPETRMVRFRTLGCYPLTGAVVSTADTVPKILLELQHKNISERGGRVIDRDQIGAMEHKKQGGYF